MATKDDQTDQAQQAIGYELPTYYQPGYPLLSFLFALYCDTEFSKREYATWVEARDQRQDYRGYLAPYQTGERPFPDAAELQIAVEVPKSTILVDGRYIPERATAERCVPYLVAEIVGAPAKSGKQRVICARPTVSRPAFVYPVRPLLSTLAVVLLNGDRSAWNTYEFDERVTAVLRALAAGTPMSAEEAELGLREELVKEFCKPPACW